MKILFPYPRRKRAHIFNILTTVPSQSPIGGLGVHTAGSPGCRLTVYSGTDRYGLSLMLRVCVYVHAGVHVSVHLCFCSPNPWISFCYWL